MSPYVDYQIQPYHTLSALLQYKQLYRNAMTKLFADLELKKHKMEEAESKDRKRQRDEEDAVEHKAKKDKEWKQEWEVCVGYGKGSPQLHMFLL